MPRAYNYYNSMIESRNISLSCLIHDMNYHGIKPFSEDDMKKLNYDMVLGIYYLNNCISGGCIVPDYSSGSLMDRVEYLLKEGAEYEKEIFHHDDRCSFLTLRASIDDAVILKLKYY